MYTSYNGRKNGAYNVELTDSLEIIMQMLAKHIDKHTCDVQSDGTCWISVTTTPVDDIDG